MVRSSQPAGVAVSVCVWLLGLAAPAASQSLPLGPMALQLSPTPRTTALGQAWVAGRDVDVLFYNPAQIIGARPSADLAITRFGATGTTTMFGSTYAAGKWSLTLGWGVLLTDFSPLAAAVYPVPADALFEAGPSAASSTLVVVGGAIVFKGWRIGAAGKYAADRLPDAGPGERGGKHAAWLVDVGASRPLFGGTAAVAAQNLGDEDVRRQLLGGWTIARTAGPLDLALLSQLTIRDGWTGGGAGVEAGYSWIEGYSVAVRAGVRRPDGALEKPVAIGAAFTADRVTVEYARQFFEDGRASNGVTIRWR
jgi:hypothetical protein